MLQLAGIVVAMDNAYLEFGSIRTQINSLFAQQSMAMATCAIPVLYYQQQNSIKLLFNRFKEGTRSGIITRFGSMDIERLTLSTQEHRYSEM